jgi:hypothetical protein
MMLWIERVVKWIQLDSQSPCLPRCYRVLESWKEHRKRNRKSFSSHGPNSLPGNETLHLLSWP